MISKMYDPALRTGELESPTCALKVVPIECKNQDGKLQKSSLLVASENATELEMLRNIVSHLGVRWGHDPFGWWATVPNMQYPSWSVWRQDDNGNQFRMDFNLSEMEARQMLHHYESLGHKQYYWAQDEILNT